MILTGKNSLKCQKRFYLFCAPPPTIHPIASYHLAGVSFISAEVRMRRSHEFAQNLHFLPKTIVLKLREKKSIWTKELACHPKLTHRTCSKPPHFDTLWFQPPVLVWILIFIFRWTRAPAPQVDLVAQALSFSSGALVSLLSSMLSSQVQSQKLQMLDKCGLILWWSNPKTGWHKHSTNKWHKIWQIPSFCPTRISCSGVSREKRPLSSKTSMTRPNKPSPGASPVSWKLRCLRNWTKVQQKNENRSKCFRLLSCFCQTKKMLCCFAKFAVSVARKDKTKWISPALTKLSNFFCEKKGGSACAIPAFFLIILDPNRVEILAPRITSHRFFGTWCFVVLVFGGCALKKQTKQKKNGQILFSKKSETKQI